MASPTAPTDPSPGGEPDDAGSSDPDGVVAGDDGGGGDAGRGDGGEGRRWYQPPSAFQAVAMVLALLFFGGAAGWVLAERAAEPDPSATDIGFLQDMITHHEQAVEMAFAAIDSAEDPAVRHFAQEVLFFQAREIGIMQQQLEDWGVDTSERPDDAMGWMDMTVPAGQMPGMATAAQMDELRSAEGSEVDRLFLELMTLHHLGGVHMADAAVERASSDEVVDLAEILSTNQSREVGEFRHLQQTLGFPVTE
jgi:uncharacterized protein (DUF305 family)